MEYKEFSGKTVEDAITAACEEFLVASDKLDYETIDSGSTGFLGIGAKPAIIKARVLEEKKEPVKVEKTEKPAKAAAKEEKKAEKKVEKAEKKEVKEEKKAEKKEASKEKEEIVSAKREDRIPTNVDEAAVKAQAEKFLTDIFKSMNISVNIKTEYVKETAELICELSGEEMGVLIGKRGQTLDSLQYLTSLVVNKGVNGYIRVKVDTEDYRRRRKETLENLAKNISYKVKRTRKSVSLEPMNPYERRIIHSALQNDKYVSTHSEGEEPYRKVVVVPKNRNKYDR